MTTRNEAAGLTGWIVHRLVANYWFLALWAVLGSFATFALTLHWDRNGLTDWLLDNDLAPVQTADAAKEVAGVVAGIDAALVTLYFSISLIVLTIAAANLGVRLIDRWLGKRLVRVSIAGLSFTLIYAVLTLAAIDSEADLADTPLATVALTIGFLAINIAMLAVALHDLGRTMFVDKAIDSLASDAVPPRLALEAGAPFTGEFAQRIPAPCHGYVEGLDLDRLARKLADHPGAIRICVAPGQHVIAGETLVAFETEFDDTDGVRFAIAIGPFRSDSQGAVFQIRLLVEIAARALSPAVNDFYTALAAGDSLAEVMVGHRETWIDDTAVPVRPGTPAFELPGQDFRGLFGDPLAAFRQAAADYPSIAIRMIGNYRRVCQIVYENGGPDGLLDFLYDEAKALAEHAAERAQYRRDRDDIEAKFEEFRPLRTARSADIPAGGAE